jgi:hypothetical protein
MNLDNASWIEIVYSGMALIGLLTSIFGVADCWKDLRAVRDSRLYGARLLFARKTVRGEIMSGQVQLLLLCLGTYLMFQPPANPSQPVTMNGVILGFVLVAVEVILMLKSLFDRYDRVRLVRYMSALSFKAPFDAIERTD